MSDDEIEIFVAVKIDGKTYLRNETNDEHGTPIYDENGNTVGQYNFKTKKWISRIQPPPKSPPEERGLFTQHSPVGWHMRVGRL